MQTKEREALRKAIWFLEGGDDPDECMWHEAMEILYPLAGYEKPGIAEVLRNAEPKSIYDISDSAPRKFRPANPGPIDRGE